MKLLMNFTDYVFISSHVLCCNVCFDIMLKVVSGYVILLYVYMSEKDVFIKRTKKNCLVPKKTF